MKKYMQRAAGVVLTGLLLFALVVGMMGCPNPAEPEIETKLHASDGAAGDCLGWSVSIDGDYAIVGAVQDDDQGTDSGSVYVFVRSGADWTQQAKLLPSDGAQDDYFGYSVSISGDYAIVGAVQDDDQGDASGSAYIYD